MRDSPGDWGQRGGRSFPTLPKKEECVAALAGFGAGAPFTLFAGTLIRDGVIDPTPGFYAGVILAHALVATVIAIQVKRSIVWQGATPDG